MSAPIRLHLRSAAVAAAVVVLAGFGALFGFWVATPTVPGRPGLFDYLSATWGDGLALPIMTGALVLAIRLLPKGPRERLLVLGAGLLGGLLGSWTQVQWLRDDAPELNWTLTRPHHFNAVGWYHAAFLIVMSGVAAALWAWALIRTAHAPGGPDNRRAVKISWGIALTAGVVFVVLLAADAVPSRTTSAGTATIVAAGTGVAVLLGASILTAVLAGRRRRRRTVSPF
ncbi:hypothetical protein [Streptomyces prunicolor]|uniref:hypothetical protein n=1 Tax=Streptomyces prunicolor TaxID=67348 RepID=UPI0033DC88EA